MKFSWQPGNKARLLVNGEAFFPAVIARIQAARTEILLESFILEADEVGQELQQALLDAAARGVHIEIIVDGYGSDCLTGEYVAQLVKAGIHIQAFDPTPRFLGMRTNLFRRLHRKIVVVDMKVAFVGGINFCESQLAEQGPRAKQDYAVEVEGPVVHDIRQASLALLTEYGDASRFAPPAPPTLIKGDARILLVLRDNQRHRTDIEDQYLQALRNARDRIIIANAYFLPSYRILRELKRACRRGVKVTLILQGLPDMPWVRTLSTLLYNDLLRHGIVIQEYCQRSLHGKVAVVDHDWCTVGSSNLDPLSLSLNLEANLVVKHHGLNRQLHDSLSELATNCRRVSRSVAAKGYWWRTPLISLCFHFLRRFPALTGMLPAHTPRLEPLEKVLEEELRDELDAQPALTLSSPSPSIKVMGKRNEKTP